MNYVYLVYYQEAYEVNEVVGVFDNLEKAEEYVVKYKEKYNVNEKFGWLNVMKVELNKEYGYCFGGIGEEV